MTERPSLLRHIACGLLTLSSFLLVTTWVRSGVPWPEALEVRAKIRAFEQTKDEYDAVYIGASDVFRAFRPNLIDPIVARESAGREEFKSYTLGIPGMWSFEADQLLGRPLAPHAAVAEGNDLLLPIELPVPLEQLAGGDGRGPLDAGP